MAVKDSTLPQTEPASSWRSLELSAFRFSFCYIILYYTPLLVTAIPGLESPFTWYTELMNGIDRRIGASLFGIDSVRLFPRQTGSGDTMLAYVHQATVLAIVLIAGTAWGLLDRTRFQYVRLHGWLRVLARYALAYTLCVYAVSKIIPTQFGSLGDRQLGETLGQMSPMSLLWNFMAFSPAYTIFGGFAELVPAVLLVFRRTALLGSLLAFAVLLNVVMLNFCFDVPVKLYSINILMLSAFLVLPHTQRLFLFFLFNQPVTGADLREPTFKKRWQRFTALGLKTALLAACLGQAIYSSMESYIENAAHPPPTPLTTRGFHWAQEEPYIK